MNIYYHKNNIILYHGDFRDYSTLRRYDTIITDPPYPRKYAELWRALGAFACDNLKYGGSLLSIVPHYLLPTVLEEINTVLKYRWIISMNQDAGSHARMAMGIEVCWKPIVWWVNGSWPTGRGFVVDTFNNKAPNNKLHKWQQGLSWARYCMKFVPESGSVIDPMMGVGTVAIACLKTQTPFIGIELDEQTIETAAKRIDDAIDKRSNREVPTV